MYEFCGESIFFESRVTEKKDLSFLRETSHFDFMDLARWIFVLCLLLFCKRPVYISFFSGRKKEQFFVTLEKKKWKWNLLRWFLRRKRVIFFLFFVLTLTWPFRMAGSGEGQTALQHEAVKNLLFRKKEVKKVNISKKKRKNFSFFEIFT